MHSKYLEEKQKNGAKFKAKEGIEYKIVKDDEGISQKSTSLQHSN
jgi:hypothetical protein